MKDQVRDVAAVKSVQAVRECPVITVKAINEKILDQLRAGRGDFDDAPYPDLGPEWVAVGKISTTGEILVRNMGTMEIRLCWDLRYCRTRQDIKDGNKFAEFRRTVQDSLPTIYIA